MDTIVVYIENENKHIDFIKSLNLLNIPHHRLFEGEKWLGLFHKIQIYLDGLKEIDTKKALNDLNLAMMNLNMYAQVL